MWGFIWFLIWEIRGDRSRPTWRLGGRAHTTASVPVAYPSGLLAKTWPWPDVQQDTVSDLLECQSSTKPCPVQPSRAHVSLLALTCSRCSGTWYRPCVFLTIILPTSPWPTPWAVNVPGTSAQHPCRSRHQAWIWRWLICRWVKLRRELPLYLTSLIGVRNSRYRLSRKLVQTVVHGHCLHFFLGFPHLPKWTSSTFSGPSLTTCCQVGRSLLTANRSEESRREQGIRFF